MKKLNLPTAKVITISNEKGGVGKTDITFNTAYFFAAKFGYRVLIADACGQGNLTTNCAVTPGSVAGLNEFIQTKKDKDNPGKYIVTEQNDFFDKGEQALPEDFISDTKYKNLQLLAGSQSIYPTQHRLFGSAGAEYTIHDRLESIKDRYDFIFIDTPPDLGTLTYNSILASNYVVLIYIADNNSLDTVSQILETIGSVQEEERRNLNNTKVLGGVCNIFDSRNKISERVLKKWMDKVKDIGAITYFFENIIDSVAITNAKNIKKTIHDHNPKHPLSHSILKFSKELHKKIEEDING